MPRIHTLSFEHASKIAAGQVVDRPASIVKELIENAIDAGATTITLRIEDGGRSRIEIEDNGCGMDESDAQKCFEKHATSKLRTFNDIATLQTFGFRGEALASIAAVSDVTLITREHTASQGTCVRLREGIITSVQPHAAAPGTHISITNLFHAIPVRKKFLKKKETEWRFILELFQAFCLDELSIHFILYNEGKLVHNCPPVLSLIDRFAQLKDKHTAENMVTIDARRESPSISVSGIVSNYSTYRYDRDGIFVFVNKRWVHNFNLSKAIVNGYKNTLPQGKFPLAIVHITLDPEYVDINIHPRKEEVQFLHPHQVQELISLAVTTALETQLTQQLTTTHHSAQLFPSPSSVSAPSASSFTPFNFSAWFSQPHSSVGPHTAPSQPISENSDIPEPVMKSSAPDTQIPLKTQNDTQEKSDHLIIGQLFSTYIMIQQTNGLLLIDQHAAHERILYEEFEKRYAHIPTISLMFPHTFDLSEEDMKTIDPYLTLINQHGIGVEILAEKTLSICASPVHLKHTSLESLIREYIAEIKREGNLQAPEVTQKITHALRARMACSAAVKAGDILPHAQIKQIINDLEKTDNRFACPHGRPTSWFIPLADIEKKFKRDYRF